MRHREVGGGHEGREVGIERRLPARGRSGSRTSSPRPTAFRAMRACSGNCPSRAARSAAAARRRASRAARAADGRPELVNLPPEREQPRPEARKCSPSAGSARLAIASELGARLSPRVDAAGMQRGEGTERSVKCAAARGYSITPPEPTQPGRVRRHVRDQHLGRRVRRWLPSRGARRTSDERSSSRSARWARIDGAPHRLGCCRRPRERARGRGWKARASASCRDHAPRAGNLGSRGTIERRGPA